MMKKLSFNFLLILVSLAQPIFSQNYISLFSDYLPEKFLKNEEQIEQIEYNLEQFSKTNPDLIYYYLNYLHSIAVDSIFNRDSNYYNILQYEIAVSNKYNNDWVEEEILKANGIPESNLIYGKLSSILEEFIAPEFDILNYSVQLEFDKNKQKFFTYLCLTKDTSLSYDNDVDYSSAVESTVEKLISRFKVNVKALQYDDTNYRENKIEEFLQYNLFSKGFSDGHNREIKFNVTKYLLSLIDYSNYREYSGITLRFHDETLKYNFPGSKLSENHLPYHDFTIDGTSAEILFYSIAAGYRFKLKEYREPFSHLDIDLGWSFVSKKKQSPTIAKEINKYYFLWEGEPTNFVWMFNGTVKSVTWELNKFTSLSSDIFLPVFYLSRTLFFEIGLHYRYLFAEYSATVYVDIVDQAANDPDMLAPETETFIRRTDGHIFAGSATVNFEIFKSLFLKATASTHSAYQISLGYLFTL